MPASIQDITFHDLPALQLSLPNGASAIVTLYGAQVLSWIPPGGKEWLYLSDKADYTPGKSIRGGVPVCFPQFSGQGPLPKHGFARQLNWRLLEKRSGKDYALVRLELTEQQLSDEQRALWPHPFRAELIIGLEGQRLDLEFEVENTGEEAFTFTGALHSYLRVDEAEEMSLEGLRGLEYRDAADGNQRKFDRGTRVIVDDELDRVYYGAGPTQLLRETFRALAIHRENFPEVVVWNPWEQKCAELSDMPANGFRRMVCVEAAIADNPVTVAAGDTWWGRQTLADVTVKGA